jgi:hypothetical protein
MGIADAPNVILLFVLAFWPLHIYCAVGGSTSLALMGFGPVAVCLQTAGLLIFMVGATVIFRSKKRFAFKLFSIPIVYAAIVLATNCLPSLF